MVISSTSVILGWKISLIVFATLGLLTCFIPYPGFWTSYVLDIVGPAWGYILFRGTYSPGKSSFLAIKFTPEAAVLLVFGICIVIETSQYFQLYDAHFDPYDYVAYFSLLFPCYLADKILENSAINGKTIK